ncbi:hypothetical protein HZC21_02685 [Candidatus Peregrinibacteria bacterium]|nr:hypothetical protein [Candidatus Peregrinibacteria bacterium]
MASIAAEIALEQLNLPDTEEARELVNALEQGAFCNKNYAIGTLHEAIRRDVADTLDNGIARSPAVRQKVTARKISVLILAVRARVAQMLNLESKPNAFWGINETGCSKEEFRAAPRTLLKSVEEVLTHPADKIPAKFTARETKTAQDTTLVKSIVIDPNRLSDTLVKDFGLGHLLAPKGSSKGEQIEAKTKIIPFIKETLAELKPIPLATGQMKYKNYRLFRITSGPRRGYILGTQEIAGEDRMFLTTLPDAHRRVSHIEQQYADEQRKLVDIQNRLNDIDRELDVNWQEAKMPENLQRLLNELQRIIAALKFVQDSKKQRLLKSVETAAEQLAKRNKGACRACMNETKRNFLIASRQANIPRIFGHLAHDKQMLNSHIAREHTIVVKFYQGVRSQAGKNHNGPRLADPSAPLTDDELAGLQKKTQALLDEYKTVRFQPYLAFADKLKMYFEEITAKLAAVSPLTDRVAIANAYMRAFVVSKLARFNAALMKIYEVCSLTDPYWLNIEQLKTDLEGAGSEIQRRTIAKSVHTPEYTPLWADIKILLKTLKKLMDDREKARTEIDKKAIISRIKNVISSFNLPGRIAQI